MHGAPSSQLVCFNHFRATSNAIQGRILIFFRDAVKGDQAFVERVLEGTSPQNHTHPFPDVCDLDNAYKDNVRIYMCSHILEGTNEAWLFNGQNFRCALSVSEDYRPYRHKSRTLFFITPGRWKSKTLILSTNADQKWIKQGLLLSFVNRLAIVNTVSCDYYPRSSIVKSVFNCRLPGMFNLNVVSFFKL